MSEPTAWEPVVCTPWATTGDLPSAVTSQVSDPADLDLAVAVASDILYALTGRRWRGAGCTRTVVVQAVTRCVDLAELRRADVPAARRYRTTAPLLQLPDFPVTAVTSVTDRDGGVVPAQGYRLVNGRDLWRLDSAGVHVGWDSREYVVAYVHGQGPPAGGVSAAVSLAGQLALARVGSDDCRLPTQVQSVTRQGVTMTMRDPAAALDKGLTGLPDVDAWVRSVNPSAAPRRPQVWSPDTATTITHEGA